MDKFISAHHFVFHKYILQLFSLRNLTPEPLCFQGGSKVFSHHKINRLLKLCAQFNSPEEILVRLIAHYILVNLIISLNFM